MVIFIVGCQSHATETLKRVCQDRGADIHSKATIYPSLDCHNPYFVEQTPGLCYTMYYMVMEVFMLAIRLEKDLEQELDLLAKSKGSNRSAVVREAIVRYLEDNEDLELARQALTEARSSKSLRDLRKDLGLDS
jgi:RHH-type rel operon transcriptional repressor/antitoxin RelB